MKKLLAICIICMCLMAYVNSSFLKEEEEFNWRAKAKKAMGYAKKAKAFCQKHDCKKYAMMAKEQLALAQLYDDVYADDDDLLAEMNFEKYAQLLEKNYAFDSDDSDSD